VIDRVARRTCGALADILIGRTTDDRRTATATG
jgi:hypothetical protein